MKRFLGILIIATTMVFNCVTTSAGFWEDENVSIFDETYNVDIDASDTIYDTYQDYFINLKARGVTVDELEKEYMTVLSTEELDYLMLGACNDLFDMNYVNYELIDMIFTEYGKRNNPLFLESNPMLGMRDLVSEQKQKAFNKQYPYFVRFPQQIGDNQYDIMDPGLVIELMDSFFQIAPINNEPYVLYPQLMSFLDRNTKVSYYYISNHKNLFIRQLDCDTSLQINFDSFYRGRIENIRIQSDNPDIINSYVKYFKNTKIVKSKWCKIASGKDYIEFHNMYNGSYRINKILTDEIKRIEREKVVMDTAFIQSDIDYYNSLFND